MAAVNQSAFVADGQNIVQLKPMQRDYRAIRDAIISKLQPVFFVAPAIVSAGVRLVEFLTICLVAFLCAREYPGFTADIETEFYAVATLVGAAATLCMFELLGVNKLQMLLRPTQALPKIALSWLVVFASLIIVLFMTKLSDSYSRAWLLLWAISGFAVIIIGRNIIASVLKSLNSSGQFNRRAVLMGGGQNLDDILRLVGGSADAGVSILGFFDDRDDTRVAPEIAGCTKLGRFADVVDFVRAAKADLVIITLPASAEARLISIIDALRVLPADVRISAQGHKIRFRPRAYSYVGNLACLDVSDRPLGDWGPLLKGVADRIIAFFAIIFLSPIMLIAALAVKLDSPGPLIFRQKRYGFNNELIEVYKFRSMKVNMSDSNATKLVTRDDPRVTRVGKILRRTSIDELPQLFNVLKGELSLVGPRPHATRAKANGELYESVVDGYFARHRVKPGITGWAQINGWRGETETEEQIQRRVDHDLYYIENWSLTFDLYILARTPLSLLNVDRAY
jgi:Undecaprenyl-phosphate glucose phosphotransferase